MSDLMCKLQHAMQHILDVKTMMVVFLHGDAQSEANLRKRALLSAACGGGSSVAKNFHFIRPKTNFSDFKKWKAKKSSLPIMPLGALPPTLLAQIFLSGGPQQLLTLLTLKSTTAPKEHTLYP